MIERFNFYDIYGYLLPGLLFLGLLWLPFGIVDGNWPSAEWTSALAVLVLGYIAGHLLHGLAEQAFPPVVKDKNNELRFPSFILLADQDKSFSPEVKRRIVDRILIRFDINVTDAGNPDPEILKKRREDAFFLCRRALLQKDVGSYAEQFEGMYVLMQSLTTVSILTAIYYAGWALASFVLPSFQDVLLYMTVVGVVFALLWHNTPKLLWLLLAVLLVLGATAGSDKSLSLYAVSIFLGISFTLLFIARRFYASYRQFAFLFAQTVYRDFCALP